MSDTTLAFLVTGTIVGLLFAWVPLLHQAEAFTLHSMREAEEEMPDLREDDYSPHLQREAA